jgi:hypothetical protein
VTETRIPVVVQMSIIPPHLSTFLACTVPILFRAALSLNPHSGQSTPPLFGDYEAQRTWIATTYTLPISQWYTHDTQYWGLDYPPGSAYLSYLVAAINPYKNQMVIRGNETNEEKAYLRFSVLAVDCAVYGMAIVAILYAKQKYSTTTSKHIKTNKVQPDKSPRTKKDLTKNSTTTIKTKILRDTLQAADPVHLFLTLLSPPMILIDHGHFQ